MATYRLSAKLISRSDGRSATGAAAYRSGERIVDERTGEVFDYRRRGDVLHREILAPPKAPTWAHHREQLWNAVETVEKRKDAQVAREIQVSLPHELSLEQQRELLHGWVREQLVERGMVADVAIHAAHKGGDERNVHAHVLLTTRTMTSEGFAGKDRSWNDRALLEAWRSSWERHLNRSLERAQVRDRVDHRSYAERGVDREPEPKQGPVATQMERGGRRSHAGDDRRFTRERNAERDRLHDEERRTAEAIRQEEQHRGAERQAERERHRQRERDRVERERTAKSEREAERPGIGHPDVPSWQRWREQALSDAYARDMADSPLARFWRIERASDGLHFTNARGQLVDEGHRVTAAQGNEIEIRGMLDIADAKGWRELTFSGGDDFKRRGMAAGLGRGFAVRAEGRDLELLREVLQQREQSQERDPNSRSRERSPIPKESERVQEALQHCGKPVERPNLRPGLHYTGNVLAIEREGDTATLYLDWGRSVVAFEVSRQEAERVEIGARARVQVERDERVTVRAFERDRGREQEHER